MLSRAFALPAFLLALGSTAAAQIQIVQQTRAISGTAHAQNAGGSQDDSFHVAAPDTATFQVFDSAQVNALAVAADAGASQTSQLAGDRITAYGNSNANAWAGSDSASALASGRSDLSVTFQVIETLGYSLTGSIGRTGISSGPTVQFGQGGVLIHSVFFTGGENQLSFEFHGVLTPGEYALSAITRADAAAFQQYSDSESGSFHVVLALDPLAGNPYCAGDGTGAACPCANNSSPGAGVGCLNSLGMGGKLRAEGVASLSNDTLVLLGSQMPNSSALFFQGTLHHNGGNGASFGDGKRCAGGTVTRLGEKNNVMGASHYPSPGNAPISVQGSVTSPGTRTYQVWYRNAANYCTAATYNMTNGVEVIWGA